MKNFKKRQRKTRTVKSYFKEYSLINDMSLCSSRYLLSVNTDSLTDEQYAEREKLAKKIREYCSIKMRQIEKECLKHTGKTVISCLRPYKESKTKPGKRKSG